MILYDLIRARRKELGISQGELAQRIAKMSKQSFSQPAMVLIENGTTKRPKLLPYICKALDLKMSDVDPEISKSIDEETLDIFERVKMLPPNIQIAVARQILKDLNV